MDPGTATAVLTAAGMALEGGQLLWDFLTTDEQEELAALYSSGRLDPKTEAMIGKMVNRQFANQRSEMGANLARRGLANSSVTGRMITDSYTDQYNALAERIAGEALRRQGLGYQMQAQLDAEEQASAANLFSMAGNWIEYSASEKHNKKLEETARATMLDNRNFNDRYLEILKNQNQKTTPLSAPKRQVTPSSQKAGTTTHFSRTGHPSTAPKPGGGHWNYTSRRGTNVPRMTSEPKIRLKSKAGMYQ